MKRYQPAVQMQNGVEMHGIVDKVDGALHGEWWAYAPHRDATMDELNRLVELPPRQSTSGTPRSEENSRTLIRNGGVSRYQRVRITVRDGVSADRSYYEDFWTHEKTPGVAAQDLIASLYLRDGDTLEISFLGDVP